MNAWPVTDADFGTSNDTLTLAASSVKTSGSGALPLPRTPPSAGRHPSTVAAVTAG